MTEIGMALSNPYRGLREAGTVGQPLPGVSVQIVPLAAHPDSHAAEPVGASISTGTEQGWLDSNLSLIHI